MKETKTSVAGKACGRRHFAAEYKERILSALEACTQRGEATALLEREGLYWSHVANWRRQRDKGQLEDSWTESSTRQKLEELTAERRELLAEIETIEAENAGLRRVLAVVPAAQFIRERVLRLFQRITREPGHGEGSGGVDDRR